MLITFDPSRWAEGIKAMAGWVGSGKIKVICIHSIMVIVLVDVRFERRWWRASRRCPTP